MNRRTTMCCSLAICAVASLAAAGPPWVDPPTPPPCAADGTCYPNTSEWGYYPARWRTWPGVQLEPTPSKAPTEADRRVSPELGPSEPPPAELEDAAAPPSSPKRQVPAAVPPIPGEQPSSDGDAIGLPNVPLPDDEGLSPLGSNHGQDPPPTLPRSISGRRPAAGVGSAAPRVSTSDPPPAPPWAQSASL